MKKEALGDTLLLLSVTLIILAWVLGIATGALLRVLSLIRPQTKPWVERTLNLNEHLMIGVTKYAGIFAGALLLISILSSLLGWGPPMMTSERGDIDR